jgi:hypothetical protein
VKSPQLKLCAKPVWRGLATKSGRSKPGNVLQLPLPRKRILNFFPIPLPSPIFAAPKVLFHRP